MNIQELAKQAGFTELEFFGNKVGTNVTECLERFRAMVLEEAAKTVDRSSVCFTADQVQIKQLAKNAIRALKGEKE